MTRLRAEDLPKKVRDKLGLEGKGSGSRKKSRAGIGHGEPCAGHCGCGEPFESYLAFEKHAAATGHARWSIDLPPSTARRVK